MSEAEKSAQIGDAVQLLLQRKRDLAHLQEKVEKVKRAYLAFGMESARWAVDSATGEELFLAHPSAAEREMPRYLFGAAELAALVREVQAAAELVRLSTAKLAGFGIAL